MKKFLIVLLMIVESCSLFLLYKSSTSKKEEDLPLENVVYNEKQTEFVYLLEQNYSKEDYVESLVNNWPDDSYKFNQQKSNCLDYNSTEINNALIYNEIDNIIILDTDIAQICYLYFNKK